MGPSAGKASDADGGDGDQDFGQNVDGHGVGGCDGIGSGVGDGECLRSCCGESLCSGDIGCVADSAAVEHVAVAF